MKLRRASLVLLPHLVLAVLASVATLSVGCASVLGDFSDAPGGNDASTGPDSTLPSGADGSSPGSDGTIGNEDVTSPSNADGGEDAISPTSDAQEDSPSEVDAADAGFDAGPPRDAATPFSDGGCDTGYHDCAGTCVGNTLTSSCGPTSCTACVVPAHGTATCNGTSCGISCGVGYNDCGGVCASTTSTTTCGPTCTDCPPVTGGTPTCNGTSCGFTCDASYHLCSNACASNASVNSCGTTSCTPCPPVADANPTCNAATGVCGFTCIGGYHLCGSTCDSNSSTSSCGSSCTVCPNVANATTTCNGTSCGFTCLHGYELCSGGTCEASCPTVTEGNNGIGCAGLNNGWGNDLIFVESFSLPAMTITAIGMNIIAGSPANTGYLAVYADSGGTPGELVAATPPGSSLVAGTNLLATTSAVSISAGTYWIGGDGVNDVYVCKDSTAITLDYYPEPETNAAQNPFPLPVDPVSDVQIAVWVVGH